jgi:glycosyltransferase involved in cell wall biosynthesis
LDLLAKSFKNLAVENKDLVLAFIGPDYGMKSEILKICNSREIQERIIFTGFVKEEMKYSAIVESEIFITPTYSGFPISFLEACYFKKPIITTKEGDELDWLDGKVGLVTDYSIKGLSQGIERLLNDEEKCIQYGVNGKELVIRNFNWVNITGELENVYGMVANTS